MFISLYLSLLAMPKVMGPFLVLTGLGLFMERGGPFPTSRAQSNPNHHYLSRRGARIPEGWMLRASISPPHGERTLMEPPTFNKSTSDTWQSFGICWLEEFEGFRCLRFQRQAIAMQCKPMKPMDRRNHLPGYCLPSTNCQS